MHVFKLELKEMKIKSFNIAIHWKMEPKVNQDTSSTMSTIKLI